MSYYTWMLYFSQGLRHVEQASGTDVVLAILERGEVINHVLVYYKQQGFISVDPNYRITVHD